MLQTRRKIVVSDRQRRAREEIVRMTSHTCAVRIVEENDVESNMSTSPRYKQPGLSGFVLKTYPLGVAKNMVTGERAGMSRGGRHSVSANKQTKQRRPYVCM